MKREDIDNELNEQGTKGLAIVEDDVGQEAKWCSLWVTPQEATGIFGLKMHWRKMGIKLPFSQILRTLANRGLDNIDWEELKRNPASLFNEVKANG